MSGANPELQLLDADIEPYLRARCQVCGRCIVQPAQYPSHLECYPYPVYAIPGQKWPSDILISCKQDSCRDVLRALSKSLEKRCLPDACSQDSKS